jgi:hypothetical protein
MAKDNKIEKISDPGELDKILKRTNPVVWIVLGMIIILLIVFFLWTFFTTLEVKVHLDADIFNSRVVATTDDTNIDRLSVGQKAYIGGMTGIVAAKEDDGRIIISDMPLDNGSYDCFVVVKEIKPIEFLLNN